MKNLLLFIMLFLPLALAAQSKGTDILGVWLNEKKEAVVEIYLENDEYFGKIIDIKGEHAERKNELKDKNNPNPEFRDRHLIQMPLIENMKFKDGKYEGGTAYNPRMGRYFKCKIWLVSNSIMKIRGYWGIIYATETWERLR
ncbi:MAG: DUF2147 domain-containing protein [Bacteroidota bacterium]